MSISKNLFKSVRVAALAAASVMLIASATGASAHGGHGHGHGGKGVRMSSHSSSSFFFGKHRRDHKIGGLFCYSPGQGCLVHVSGPRVPVATGPVGVSSIR
jgi:hypothetical protein